jgi:hypothetical protein
LKEFLAAKGIEGVEGSETFPKAWRGKERKQPKTALQSDNPYCKQHA